MAIEWHEHHHPNWSQGYADDIPKHLQKDVFPFICKRAIAEIKAAEVLAVLSKTKQHGVLDKLKKPAGKPTDIYLGGYYRQG